MSLIARHLESRGIPTICLTSARDITQAGRVPRAVFVDYPLGHTVGKPFDRADQLAIITAALEALESQNKPESIVTLKQQWYDQNWRQLASNPAGGDTRASRNTTPQWQYEADRVAAQLHG